MSLSAASETFWGHRGAASTSVRTLARGAVKEPRSAAARARRDEREARFPASRVYGLTVEDPMAQMWESQAIVFATSPDEARVLFQEVGFFKRNSQPIEPDELAAAEFDSA